MKTNHAFDVPDIIQSRFDLVIALDTEWTVEHFTNDPPLGLTLEKIPSWSRTSRNHILSYQLVAVDTRQGLQTETIRHCLKRPVF
jgi:hypothetical protein